MPIGSQSGLDFFVPQTFFDDQWVFAHADQQGGVGMTKLVEATNGHFLVEAENEIWYDIASGYGFCRSLFY